MNNVYFACRDCKDYIDAGYRWPVSTLYEDQWSNFPLTVSVDEVLAHAEYWSGESLHPYLAQTLPAARAFLLAHRTHDLVFGDSESFSSMDGPTYSYLHWLGLNSLTDACYDEYCFEPRYFAQHPGLRYTSWSEVDKYCAANWCAWNGDAAATEIAREVFERAVDSSS